MRGGVFIDTGAFAAFLNRADRQHSKAKALFDDLPGRKFTSILVVSECCSWCLHKLGEPAARSLRAFLTDLRGLQILSADLSHHEAVTRGRSAAASIPGRGTVSGGARNPLPLTDEFSLRVLTASPPRGQAKERARSLERSKGSNLAGQAQVSVARPRVPC